MAASTIKAGYVVDKNDNIYVQIPADNQWGFSITSDDQTWPGGFGIGEWKLIAEDDARITDEVRVSLQWILDEAE